MGIKSLKNIVAKVSSAIIATIRSKIKLLLNHTPQNDNIGIQIKNTVFGRNFIFEIRNELDSLFT